MLNPQAASLLVKKIKCKHKRLNIKDKILIEDLIMQTVSYRFFKICILAVFFFEKLAEFLTKPVSIELALSISTKTKIT